MTMQLKVTALAIVTPAVGKIELSGKWQGISFDSECYLRVPVEMLRHFSLGETVDIEVESAVATV